MAYKLCLALIAKGKTDGLREKLEVFLAADSITADQFSELMAMLNEGN